MESKDIIPPTLPTFGHSTVYVYPTVSPRVVVVPIISCIIGFPLLVMLVICGLRYRARRARISAKKTHNVESSVFELASGPSILSSRCSNGKAHRQKRKKALVRFKPMPEIDLDTVVEEKSEFDAEVTASDLLTTPDDLVIPEEATPPASFRAFRYMGPVQAATATASPLRSSSSSASSPHFRALPEGLGFSGDVVLDVSDDECLGIYDEDEDDEDEDEDEEEEEEEEDVVPCEAEGGDGPPDGGDEGRGSGGSSDSETVEACFSLSPKQASKAPTTGVHLSLKREGSGGDAARRRHSSPVRVSFSRARRSSGRASCDRREEEDPKDSSSQAGFDYIDRELMPDASPRSRSHSVKVKRPSGRRAASFAARRRRGESLRLRSRSFSRGASQEPDGGHDEGRRRTAKRATTATPTAPLHNGVLECDVHNEDGGAAPDAGGADPPSASPSAVQGDRRDGGSVGRAQRNAARTACGDGGASFRAGRSHRNGRGSPPPPTTVAISIVNEFEMKYKQEDVQASNHCNKCLDAVDKEAERSTLV